MGVTPLRIHTGPSPHVKIHGAGLTKPRARQQVRIDMRSQSDVAFVKFLQFFSRLMQGDSRQA